MIPSCSLHPCCSVSPPGIHCAGLLCLRRRSHKTVGVLKTPSALLFHFSRYTECKVNVGRPVIHYTWICFLVGIYTMWTPHWQDYKLYFQSEYTSFKWWVCVADDTLIAFTLHWMHSFWQIKQDCVSMTLLSPTNYCQSYCVISHRLT